MQQAASLTSKRAAELEALDAADREDIAAAQERLRHSNALNKLAQAERELAELDLERVTRRSEARAEETERFNAKFGKLAAPQGTANWH